jgi:hypothetical protein
MARSLWVSWLYVRPRQLCTAAGWVVLAGLFGPYGTPARFVESPGQPGVPYGS